MTKFNVYYTDRAQLDSAFIERVWYDNRDGELSIEMNGLVYSYDNVPSHTYEDFVRAESAGRFYRDYIQGTLRGRRRGPVSDLVAVGVDKHLGSVEVRNVETANVVNWAQPAQEVQKSGASTLAYQTTPLKQGFLPLNKDVVVNTAYEHTLFFTVDDNSEERKYVVKANSMDDAIENFFNLVKALDVDVELKGVLVRFE